MNIINLGRLLEVEECEGYYNLIIDRMDQKQVIAFKKDAILLFEDGSNDIRTDVGKDM